MLRVRRPQIRRDVIARQALFLALILYFVVVGSERGQFCGADQNFFFTGGSVYIPKLAVLSLIVALDEREFRAIGTPLHVFRTASGQTAGSEDGFDGERLRRRGRLSKKRGNSGKQYSGEQPNLFFHAKP